jgi:cytochrome b6-f complex iron-sulfur subunit
MEDLPMDSTVTRRAVLAAGTAGAGALALGGLAACSSGSGSPSAAKSAQQASTELAKLADIPIGQAVAAKLPDGSPAIVCQPAAGTASCFSAICTHLGCTVIPAGKELHCPCHGSVYEAATGAVISGPAPRPLPRIAVHVASGSVVSGA